MEPVNAVDVVLKFTNLINTRNADSVCSMLADHAVLIDSLGNRIEGLPLLRAAWESYFMMMPDYHVEHTEIFAEGDRVAIVGTVGGTLSRDGQLHRENYWRSPAVWKAVAKDGKIVLWQIFADNEPLRQVLRKQHARGATGGTQSAFGGLAGAKAARRQEKKAQAVV